MEPTAPSRAVLLVEGISDQCAVVALARRRSRDLAAEGVAVQPMGGYGNLRRFLERFGPTGADVRLAGLYDAGAERHFIRALGGEATTPASARAALETLGFFACDADLEDELTRAVGPAAMEEILETQGELRAFRIYQKQPAHRERTLEEQLWGFMWNRKTEYATLLVEALDLARVPSPLDRVLAHVS